MSSSATPEPGTAPVRREIPLEDSVLNLVRGIEECITKRKEAGLYELFISYSKRMDVEWPEGPIVGKYLEGKGEHIKSLSMLLYDAMRQRDLYARGQPLPSQRDNSLPLYHRLMAEIKEAENAKLPLMLCWDLLEEFTYQLINNAKYFLRGDKHEKCIELIADASEHIYEDLIHEWRDNELLRAFALLAKLRVQISIPDFPSALIILQQFDEPLIETLSQWPIPYSSFLYLGGYLHLMTKDFALAFTNFTQLLTIISANKLTFKYILYIYIIYYRSYVFDTIGKRPDRVIGLVSVCMSLCEMWVDQEVKTLFTNSPKYSELMQKLKPGTPQVFEEILSMCGPQSINLTLTPTMKEETPAINPKSQSTPPHLKWFTTNVVPQFTRVNKIRSFLRYYRSLDVEKLSKMIGISMSQVRTDLMALKQMQIKMTAMGDLGASLCVPLPMFYIQGNLVKIAEVKTTTNYYNKLLQANNQLEALITKFKEQ